MKKLTRHARERQLRLSRKVMRRIRKKRYEASKTIKIWKDFVTLKAPDTFSIGPEEIRRKLLRFLARLRDTMAFKKRSVRIDFTATQKMIADGTLLFFAELCRLKRLTGGRVKMRCIPPRSSKVAQVLKQVNIFGLLGYRRKIEPTFADVIHWRSANGHEVKGEKYDSVLGHYDGLIADALSQKLYLGLTEAMTNCHHHAYIDMRPDGLSIAHEPKEWWMFSQEKDGWLTVVFCDLGIGIPGTLPIKKPTLWQSIQTKFGSQLDSHAIQEAIDESRTRTGKHHRGKGLKQLVDVVSKVDGGQVNIFSNRGRFTLKSGTESICQFKDSIFGTLIHWTVPIEGLSDDTIPN